jgi:hypothetical protein
VGIEIQKTNTGIPAFIISFWYWAEKSGLRRFIPVPDGFRHR